MTNERMIQAYFEQILPEEEDVLTVITLTAATPTPRGGFTTKAITLHTQDVVDVFKAVREKRRRVRIQMNHLQQLGQQTET